jgi:hypothetical protein
MLLRLSNIIDTAVAPALAILPPHMDSPEARCMLLAIGLQESGFECRRQKGNGPACGFWQFELGGVTGVCKHHVSHQHVHALCRARGVSFDPKPIWAALETDDVLGAGLARLLLLTDPKKLPALGDETTAWDYYQRNWRPGKPHPERWPQNYALALGEIRSLEA